MHDSLQEDRLDGTTVNYGEHSINVPRNQRDDSTDGWKTVHLDATTCGVEWLVDKKISLLSECDRLEMKRSLRT